ncbi:hypothetical protein M0R04_07535 [Candidatus Dojkabacteria bacterium]|jgi:hypothetical protein|nr:hypothetical protein [Candidatus Dojkabacteria bacterium]
MSALVFNEKLIDKKDIKEKTVTILRCANATLGVRMWFQILTTAGESFQRWTMLMNDTDEILFLVQPGDTLTLEYVEDTAEDTVNGTFESFDRNIILKVTSFKLK